MTHQCDDSHAGERQTFESPAGPSCIATQSIKGLRERRRKHGAQPIRGEALGWPGSPTRKSLPQTGIPACEVSIELLDSTRLSRRPHTIYIDREWPRSVRGPRDLSSSTATRPPSTPKILRISPSWAASGRQMGREARQGEIGLVVGDEYFAIRDFAERSRT